MRKSFFFYIMVSLILQVFITFVDTASADDMRVLQTRAREIRAELVEKAAKEHNDALREAEQSKRIIIRDKTLLAREISNLKKGNSRLKGEIKKLHQESSIYSKKEITVSTELEEAVGVVHELVGVVRMNAKDIDTFVSQNMQTALFKTDTSFLNSLINNSQFPGMDDVRHMVDILRLQIKKTGEVLIEPGEIVDMSGHEVNADILLIGPFTAAYRLAAETGFLLYSDSERKFYALAKPPPSVMRTSLEQYFIGKSDHVPVDISKGGALRQLTYSLSLWEQVENGGKVVWPILAVLVAGIFILLERMVFQLRSRMDSDTLIAKIAKTVGRGNQDEALRICRNSSTKPLARVLAAGLENANLGREEVENALQEAILREIPQMERFLSALSMLVAIAPLLGLLGTVTGMINTFHVITLHGTGDPRLMSAGISEALVTTMLGLMVAIPLMLGHNLFNGASERLITDMEEKGIALVNILIRNRENGGSIESAGTIL